MNEFGLREVVFLSVQGVEKQPWIPNHKFEEFIRAEGRYHVFLCPAYFMQNLTTTLISEIRQYERIFIPAGNLKFNWVDAIDMRLVGAHVLNYIKKFKNQPVEISGGKFTGLEEVARHLSEITGKAIRNESTNLLRFFLRIWKSGVSGAIVLVMIMLHWLPRFGINEPRLTDAVQNITGKAPNTLRHFINRNREIFL